MGNKRRLKGVIFMTFKKGDGNVEEQWYSNKDLFEQITAIQNDFKDLRVEMKETRAIIRQYNGLREELGQVKKDIADMQSKNKGKKMLSEAIRLWGGWLFAFITVVLMLVEKII